MRERKLLILFIIGITLLAIGITGIIFINKKGKNDRTDIPDFTTSTTNNEPLEDISEPVYDDLYLPITDIVFIDKTNTITDDNKEEIISSIKNETERYLTGIFNYQGYTEDFKNFLYMGMADANTYSSADTLYANKIIQSFEDNQIKSSVNKINVLGITVGLEADGTYLTCVRGYADINISYNGNDEVRANALFIDYVLKENTGNFYHMNTFLKEVFDVKDFQYHLVNDGTYEINYSGNFIFNFDLVKYDGIIPEEQPIEEQPIEEQPVENVPEAETQEEFTNSENMSDTFTE